MSEVIATKNEVVIKSEVAAKNENPPGANGNDSVDVLIEIPFGSNMKYEFDKDVGVLRCDRLLHAPHAYPFNYGYFPKTLAGDGDDLDAVVVTKYRVEVPSIMKCRIIGALLTHDEKGNDEKVLCVPHERVDPDFCNVKSLDDLTQSQRSNIEYFFTHYKDTEPDKWVEVKGFVGASEAYKIYLSARDRWNRKRPVSCDALAPSPSSVDTAHSDRPK